ncbi:MAG: type pilus assembly protein PilM [Fimbriimonadaceae bacterium]|jgi:type IV pilus assembly protein PilM|nr:type pilus assembly protein PilM [Fimbriimonadaceae bacterium]
MVFMAKQAYVGLDLGHYAIKAVQLERTSGGWKVTRAASVPTPEESLKDGVVVDTTAMAAAIKALLKDAHISASSAYVAVAGAAVVVRTVRIPSMPEATLRKSIKFEAGRYVPTSVADSYIEFEILGQSDEDNQMDVLIVAAPKEVVESRIKACQAAGLDVEAVDVEPFAVFRSIVETDEENGWLGGTIAMVDIGATTTSMSVVRDGVFAMTRSIPNGGKTLTEALKSYFKLGEEDAESGKRQLNVAELIEETKPKDNPPLRVLQSHLDDLVREIRRSLNYYQSQQTDASTNPVSRILVTGGGAKLPGMTEYLAHKLQLPAFSAGVLANPRFLHSGPPEESGLDLAVASGLAMRTFPNAA